MSTSETTVAVERCANCGSIAGPFDRVGQNRDVLLCASGAGPCIRRSEERKRATRANAKCHRRKPDGSACGATFADHADGARCGFCIGFMGVEAARAKKITGQTAGTQAASTAGPVPANEAAGSGLAVGPTSTGQPGRGDGSDRRDSVTPEPGPRPVPSATPGVGPASKPGCGRSTPGPEIGRAVACGSTTKGVLVLCGACRKQAPPGVGIPADALIDCMKCGNRHAAYIQSCNVPWKTPVDGPPLCARCNDTGVLGGAPDFPGDTHAITMSFCDCAAAKKLTAPPCGMCGGSRTSGGKPCLRCNGSGLAPVDLTPTSGPGAFPPIAAPDDSLSSLQGSAAAATASDSQAAPSTPLEVSPCIDGAAISQDNVRSDGHEKSTSSGGNPVIPRPGPEASSSGSPSGACGGAGDTRDAAKLPGCGSDLSNTSSGPTQTPKDEAKEVSALGILPLEGPEEQPGVSDAQSQPSASGARSLLRNPAHGPGETGHSACANGPATRAGEVSMDGQPAPASDGGPGESDSPLKSRQGGCPSPQEAHTPVRSGEGDSKGTQAGLPEARHSDSDPAFAALLERDRAALVAIRESEPADRALETKIAETQAEAVAAEVRADMPDRERIAHDLGRVVVAWDANDRAAGIGGSDIWTVVHDPMAVYCEKRGITAPFEDTDYTEAGRFLEPGNAAWFEYRTGMKLRGDGKLVVRHPSESWIFASPDRFVYDAVDALTGGWEGKNVSSFRAEVLGDLSDPAGYDVPDKHYYQIQWCMGVTGLRRWWYAPLVGGNRPRFDHVIEFDAALFADLVAIARAFWFGNVLQGIAPTVTASASSAAYLRARYRKVEREDLPEAPPEALPLAEQYLDAREIVAEAEERKADAGNKLKDLIGRAGAPGLLLAEGWPVTWKPNAKGVRSLSLERPKR